MPSALLRRSAGRAKGLIELRVWVEAAIDFPDEDLPGALAQRAGPILPLIGGAPDAGHARLERHVCIDTTASGGNAQLLAEVSGS